MISGFVFVGFLGFWFLSLWSESMLMVCCLFMWPAMLVCLRGVFAGDRGWNKGWSRQGLFSGIHRRHGQCEGKMQTVFSYRDRDGS